MIRKTLLFACAVLSYGQPAATPTPLKIGSVTVTGSIRSRVESWDWFKADSGDNAYTFNGNLFRISFSQAHENWDWQLEMAAPVLLGLPSNAIGAGSHHAPGGWSRSD